MNEHRTAESDRSVMGRSMLDHESGKTVGAADGKERAWSKFTAAIRRHPRLRSVLDIARLLPHAAVGGLQVKCAVCTQHVKLLPFGMPPRLNALCASCGSLERHRLLVHYFEKNTQLLDCNQILHFAPEAAIERFLRSESRAQYRSADIEIGRADLRISIEDTGLADSSFDLIIASHVLEHVDDMRALPELFRILTPGGAALIMVPMVEGWADTYEDASFQTPKDRMVRFGQEDHVRRYGRDLRSRIKSAGFELSEFGGSHEEAFEYGFQLGEVIFIAKKPVAVVSA